jgi:uncharacterized protein (UPF0332 family)
MWKGSGSMPETLDDKNRALAAYRMERAKELLAVSQNMLDDGFFKDSANRSYFAIFSAIRAVLALHGFDAKKHYGVISEFRRLYIKTGIFDDTYSEYIGSAFQVRNGSDYTDMFLVSRGDAIEQLEHAKLLVAEIERFLA